MNTQLLDVNWPFVLGTVLFYKVYSLDHALYIRSLSLVYLLIAPNVSGW